jgi:hypothetical protein
MQVISLVSRFSFNIHFIKYNFSCIFNVENRKERETNFGRWFPQRIWGINITKIENKYLDFKLFFMYARFGPEIQKIVLSVSEYNKLFSEQYLSSIIKIQSQDNLKAYFLYVPLLFNFFVHKISNSKLVIWFIIISVLT